MSSFFKSISADEFKKIISEKSSNEDFSIIDIRTLSEFFGGHIEGAKNIDFYSPDFMPKLNEIDKEKTYLIYCRSGSRSRVALAMMKRLGFQKVYELDGGIISTHE